METRRYKPFRKQPPMRRRAQLRRLDATRWETLDDEPDTEPDTELEDEWDDEWEEWDEEPEPVRVPAPRIPVHDQDLEPMPDPPDPEPAERRWRRRALVGGAVGVLVAAIIAGVLVLVGGGTDRSPTRPDQAPVAFRPPVAVPPDGEFVRTRVLRSGDLRVDHWIRSEASLSGVTVQVPEVAGIDTGSLTVRGLEAQADGLDRTESAGLSGSEHRFTFPESSTVHVRYVVHGAIQRSGPGGRALARISTLDLGYYPVARQRTLEVVGPTVLSLACSPPGGTPAPCGDERDGRWTVDLSGQPATEQVLAQVELGS